MRGPDFRISLSCISESSVHQKCSEWIFKSGIEPFNHELYKDADYSGTLMTYRPTPVPADDAVANPTLSENDDARLNPVESATSAENSIATYDSVTEAVSMPNDTKSQGTSSIENDNEKNNDL